MDKEAFWILAIILAAVFVFGRMSESENYKPKQNAAVNTQTVQNSNRASVPSNVIDIPEGVYTNTDSKDPFYEILNSNSSKKTVYSIALRGCPYSAKFVGGIKNEFDNSNLSNYYDFKLKHVSQGSHSISSPRIACSSQADCDEKFEQLKLRGEIWFLENCPSFCIIDARNRRVITPVNRSQDPKPAIDFLYTHAND